MGFRETQEDEAGRDESAGEVDGRTSTARRVEQPAAEEPSGRRFLAWVVRHLGWPSGGGLQPVDLTGVIRAPEWKDGFENARHEQPL